MTLSRTSRVLFVLAAAAVAAYVLIERPRRRDGESERLFAALRSPIDALQIDRPEGRVRAEVRGSHWELVEPVRDLADYSRIATLIDALERAVIARHLGPADDLAQYGLAPPAAEVVLESHGEAVARVELGALTVDKAHAYARRDDGDIILIPPDAIAAATHPPDSYRDPHLARFDVAQIDGFTVKRNGEEPVRWLRGNGWFTVAGHDTIAGDSVQVPMYLRRFRGMRVRAFVAPADTAGAFRSLAGRVTLHKSNAPALTLRFAARPDSVYWCRIDGTARVVAVQGDVPGGLDATVATLRDRRLLHFDPVRAQRIRLATADTAAVLVRAGGAWALPNPGLGPIDARAASDLVRALRTLQYRRVLNGSATPAEPAAFTLAVSAGGDTLLDELRGWRNPASHDWVVTSRSTGVTGELASSHWDEVWHRLRRIRTSR